MHLSAVVSFYTSVKSLEFECRVERERVKKSERKQIARSYKSVKRLCLDAWKLQVEKRSCLDAESWQGFAVWTYRKLHGNTGIQVNFDEMFLTRMKNTSLCDDLCW